ncbi:MAG: HEAT repeat domain-containing protein [Planctomycetota bacterium]
MKSRPELLTDGRFQGEVLAAFRESAGDDPKVRKFLAEILGQMRLPEAVPALKAALVDPTQDYVVAVLLALAQIGSPTAYDAVLPYAKIADANLRKLAYFVLGRIKDDQAIPVLAKGLQDEDFQARVNAIFALASFDDRRALAELKPLLDRSFLARNGFHGGQSVGAGAAEDDMEPILTNALTVAGHFHEAALRTDIDRLRASDPSPRVQRAAIEALAELDQPSR